MRLPAITVTVMDDATGRPFVEIEGTDSSASPIRMVLWADEVKVKDLRPKKVEA